MKLTVLQENFKRGLNVVSRAVAPKNTLPVLANVLLTTDGGMLKLTTTNLAIGISCHVGADIQEDGAVTIPAKLLSDVVNGLPNAPITLELDTPTQTMRLTCARFKTSIKGIEADEFPIIPAVSEQKPLITIDGATLQEAINQVAFAAAEKDTRPILCGVLLHMSGQSAHFATADGYRLAVRDVELPEPIAEPIDLIIPATAMMELARVIEDDAPVNIYVSQGETLVSFHAGDIELNSRLIEGKFPEFGRYLPQDYSTRAVLNTQELTKAVKLAALFAASAADVVKLIFTPANMLDMGEVTIEAAAGEIGENSGVVNGTVNGQSGAITLNVKLLSDAIGAISTAQVAIEIQDERSPAVLRPVGTDNLVQIVMPITQRGQ